MVDDDESRHLYTVTVMCGMASSKTRCERISSPPPIRSGFRPGSLVQSVYWVAAARVRACARYGVLVVGEEMKGLVNGNFLPYWSQKLLPLGETVGLSRSELR